MRNRRPTVPNIALVLLCLAGTAGAQCPDPDLYELGGAVGPICPGGTGTQTLYEAVARGRYVSIESSPLLSGSPIAGGRVALDHAAVAMDSEIVGRVWATDGPTIYGLNINNPASPQILGRVSPPSTYFLDRLRVRGNFVYATDGGRMVIVDVSNPAAPVLRSTFTLSGALANDLEVVGSYAYLSIYEIPNQINSIMVVDVGNVQQPVEVRRVGTGNREGRRITKAPNLTGLYAMSLGNSSAAIELWSLANPANPQPSIVNATLPQGQAGGDYDELRATNSTLCYFEHGSSSLTLYNPSNLVRIGQPIVFPDSDDVRSMGVDAPFVFVGRTTGDLARVSLNTTPATVADPYFDNGPSEPSRIANLNEGVCVLGGWRDVWLMATPVGGTPYTYSHLRGDPGFRLVGGHMALLTGGTLFLVEYQGTPTPLSRILAYRVTGMPSPTVQYQGAFNVSGWIDSLEAGYSATNVRCVYYTTGALAGGPATLHILDAANLGAMFHAGSFALSTGVGGPIRYMPQGAFPPTPPRVAVGGDATQIVNVSTPSAPTGMGVIPAPAWCILQGLPPTIWLAASTELRGYDISTPAAPVLQSTTRISLDRNLNYVQDMRHLSPFANALGLTTALGDLVRIDVGSPAAPSISQVSRISSRYVFGSSVGGLAFDGTNIHLAAGQDGYVVRPLAFSAPPRVDPDHALRRSSVQRIVAVCPGAPFTLTTRFVAVPAVTSHRWYRYDRASQSYLPLADGPTATGSTVSGSGTATLTINNPGAAEATYYYCTAANSCGPSEIDSDSVEARLGGYANCDGSTISPALNVLDFACFLNRFAAGDDAYANCDGSTTFPDLNVLDFSCFLNLFAAGCP